MTRPLSLFLAPLLAFSVLLFTFYRTSSIRLSFSFPVKQEYSQAVEMVDYVLPVTEITPENAMWPVKAAIDKVDILLTSEENVSIKALGLADERLSAAEALFLEGDYENGIPTVIKAEQYLQQSSDAALRMQDVVLYDRIAISSLKHREVLESALLSAPQDATPIISQTMDYSKGIFEKMSNSLLDEGVTPPKNPFEL